MVLVLSHVARWCGGPARVGVACIITAMRAPGAERKPHSEAIGRDCCRGGSVMDAWLSSLEVERIYASGGVWQRCVPLRVRPARRAGWRRPLEAHRHAVGWVHAPTRTSHQRPEAAAAHRSWLRGMRRVPWLHRRRQWLTIVGQLPLLADLPLLRTLLLNRRLYRRLYRLLYRRLHEEKLGF
jgi:hypothetical protein